MMMLDEAACSGHSFKFNLGPSGSIANALKSVSSTGSPLRKKLSHKESLKLAQRESQV